MTKITAVCMFVLILFIFGCRDNGTTVPMDNHIGKVSLSLTAAPAGIVRVIMKLTREGFDDRTVTLVIADTGRSASGSLADVPVGMWHLKVDAIDDSGKVKYSGETDIEVMPGQTSQVSLELLPAGGNIIIQVSWGAVCTPPPAGLVSWWRGEGDASDAVGSNNGMPLNGILFTQGKVGRAFRFNGVDQYIRIPNSATLNPTGSFSIDTWIYPEQDKWATIFCKWADYYYAPDQRTYNLEMSPGLNIGFAISDSTHQNDSSFHIFRTHGGVLKLKNWNHVAAVYNQVIGMRTIYVNGVKVAERVDAPINVFPSLADIAIGVTFRSPDALYETFFPGAIDEVDFYNRSLSEQEIKDIYSAGSAGKCR